jgi:hypothetical protein
MTEPELRQLIDERKRASLGLKFCIRERLSQGLPLPSLQGRRCRSEARPEAR